jgi:hypothetical protein
MIDIIKFDNHNSLKIEKPKMNPNAVERNRNNENKSKIKKSKKKKVIKVY